ncbi:MAG: Sec-independent protein translocase subunit TatA/TatB [Flavobacteriales bacterium]|jgi:sec-independent protein translocase protein TatA
MLLFIGGTEIFFIILLVVMLFGSKKIPEIAKGLGKMMREVKDASNEIKREIKDSAKEIKDSTKEIKDNIDKEING